MPPPSTSLDEPDARRQRGVAHHSHRGQPTSGVDWHAIVTEYRASMMHRNLSQGTVSRRVGELRRWRSWCSDHDFDWREATWRDVEQWLESRPLAAEARNGTLSHLHRFYEWALRREYTSSDPTISVDPATSSATAPPASTDGGDRPGDPRGALEAHGADVVADG